MTFFRRGFSVDLDLTGITASDLVSDLPAGSVDYAATNDPIWTFTADERADVRRVLFRWTMLAPVAKKHALHVTDLEHLIYTRVV